MKLHLGVNPEALQKAAEKAERQSAYAEKRRASLARIRTNRRLALEKRRASIESATDLYERLDGGDRPVVRIRSEFIRLVDERPPRDPSRPYKESRDLDVRTRPPLTQLIHRPSNALSVWMTAVYLAHLEHDPGAVVTNTRQNNFASGWSDLSGLFDRNALTKENNLRLTRALGKLADAKLVKVGAPGSRNRFEGFSMWREDGKGDKAYKVPGESSTQLATAFLPASFFYFGWHLVLTPEEIAAFLAIVLETQRHYPRLPSDRPRDQGIGLPRKTRWSLYGLASEAYNSIHELKEFGLIDIVDPNRVDLERLTLRLIWTPDREFTEPAYDVVMNCLSKNTTAPRADA